MDNKKCDKTSKKTYSQTMKILVISNLYGAEAKGGAEKFAALEVAQLRAKGHEVHVLHASRKKTHTRNGEIAYQTHNVFFYGDIATKSFAVRALFHVIDLLAVRSAVFVYRLIKNGGYDRVITHNLKGLGMVIPRAIAATKVPHEHVVHDIQLVYGSGLLWFGEENKVRDLVPTIFRVVTRMMWGSPTQVRFLSHYAAQLHDAYGFFPDSKKEVMVPTQAYTPRPIHPKEKINFLFVGQIEKHKGIELLCAAMKKFPNHTVTIVGEGSLFTKLSRETGENILWVGKKTSEEVGEIMQQHDVLVVPSIVHENAPRVIVEAHAAGMVVCASEVGGIPELLLCDDVMFTPTQDGLEHALQEMITRLQDTRLCFHDERPR